MIHLSDLEVAALVDGGLQGSEQRRIERHLRACLACTGRVEEVRFLMQSMLARSLWQEVTDVVRRLRFDLMVAVGPRQAHGNDDRLAPGLRFTHAFSGMLGGAEDVRVASLEIPSDDGMVLFRFTWEVDAEGLADLRLLVFDAGGEASELGATVSLREESGRMLERRRTEADGSAKFDKLTPGTYVIQVTHEGKTYEFRLPLAAAAGDSD